MPQATSPRDPGADAPAAAPTPEHAAVLAGLTEVVVGLKRRSGDGDDRARLALLALLLRHGPVRATYAAEHLGLDLSTVSRHLKALEDRGLVTRAPDPDDGRASLLSLSPEGLDVLTTAREAGAARLAAVTRDWDHDDVVALARLLTRLSHDLENL